MRCQTGSARRRYSAAIAGCLIMVPAVVFAQIPLPDPTQRSGDRPPVHREELQRIPPPPILPPPPIPESEREKLPGVRVVLREIRIVGNTVFPAEELQRIAAPYVNREVTSEELEAIRVVLTLHYVNRGYVNSGAILPDQVVRDGIVTYQIIEGRLTDIDVQGVRWFRPAYVRQRLRLGAGPPLNVDALQERLHLLQLDPRIERISAQLRRGVRPGEGVLAVDVEDRQPIRLSLEFNNYLSPSVGAERGMVVFEHQNVIGFGDAFLLRYGRSEGVDPQLDLRYAVPFTPWDTTFSAQYRKTDFMVIDPVFEPLEIRSESKIVSVSLRQPVYRSPIQEFALEVTGERLQNETSLLGEPFSLTAGPHRGKSVVAAARFGQEWVYRSQSRVFAVRSRVSLGFDALGATINRDHDVPDGKFVAWFGQAQWVQRLPWNVYAILRGDMQLTDDPLLSLEQFSLGGRYTVRGYRENTFVGDNGALASLELRLPLLQAWHWIDYIELAPFFDHGRGWNVNPPGVAAKPMTLQSAGVGLRWGLTIPLLVRIRPQFEVYWGRPLPRDDNRQRRDPFQLQDEGVHIGITITAF